MSKKKQAILRAIAIKLEVETHKKFRKVMTKLFWLFFAIFLVCGLYNAFTRHMFSSEILDNAIHIEANIEELPDYISDTQASYRYTFEVNGNQYQKDFITSYENYEKYTGNEGIKISYKKSDPSMFGITEILNEHKGIGTIIKHFLKMLFVGGIGFLVIYMFITSGIVQPTVEYEDDDDIDNEKN